MASPANFHLTCSRFYEQKYPDLDDLVVVKVRSIEATAAYCHLLEYNNCEGMIPLSQISRRRIRSIGKHLKVGKTEIMQVYRVDTQKGYIDLSKKTVTPDDIQKATDKFNNAKAVHSIVSHVGMEWCKSPKCDFENLEQIYEQIIWPLVKRFGTSHEAFKIANSSPEKVLGPLELDPDLFQIFVKDIQERLKVQPHRIRSNIAITCFEYEGVDSIKEVLALGAEMGTESCPLKITLTACPSFVLRVQSLDREDAFKTINSAIDRMTALMKERGGTLKVEKEAWETTAEDARADDRESDDDDDDDDSTDDESDDEEDRGEIMEASKPGSRKRK